MVGGCQQVCYSFCAWMPAPTVEDTGGMNIFAGCSTASRLKKVGLGISTTLLEFGTV